MQKYLRLASLVCLSLVLALSMKGSVSASHSTFKQTILPLNCVFQIVDTGSGQIIQYITPEECGQIITPPPTTPPTNNPQLPPSPDAGGPIATPINIDQPTGVEADLFETIQNRDIAATKQGFTRTLTQGTAYVFQLPGQHLSHHITVLLVARDSAVVLFASAPHYVTLQLGRVTAVDLDDNGKPDINAKLTRIISPSKVEFSVWLLGNTSTGHKGPLPTSQLGSSPWTLGKWTIVILFVLLCATLVIPLKLQRFVVFPPKSKR